MEGECGEEAEGRASEGASDGGESDEDGAVGGAHGHAAEGVGGVAGELVGGCGGEVPRLEVVEPVEGGEEADGSGADIAEAVVEDGVL